MRRGGCIDYLSVRNLERWFFNAEEKNWTHEWKDFILLLLFLSPPPPWETLQLHLHRGNDDSAIFNLAGAIISSFSSLPPPTLSLSLSVFLPFYHNPARFYLYFGDNNGPRGARNVKEINHGMPGNIYAVSKEEHRALLGFGLSIF